MLDKVNGALAMASDEAITGIKDFQSLLSAFNLAAATPLTRRHVPLKPSSKLLRTRFCAQRDFRSRVERTRREAGIDSMSDVRTGMDLYMQHGQNPPADTLV
ncbi:hypothetical protein PENANT_c015G10106 [Penicillium antarcticum]|uniref:Uncharacterized protein n=1 Tax=Penicillium antarcticum TaxID=416450 RepID=A0A1V6Q384_9EURO|nr:hypothetical protein PENANT_c015G10106 [Penicillium antarcticum]